MQHGVYRHYKLKSDAFIAGQFILAYAMVLSAAWLAIATFFAVTFDSARYATGGLFALIAIGYLVYVLDYAFWRIALAIAVAVGVLTWGPLVGELYVRNFSPLKTYGDLPAWFTPTRYAIAAIAVASIVVNAWRGKF